MRSQQLNLCTYLLKWFDVICSNLLGAPMLLWFECLSLIIYVRKQKLLRLRLVTSKSCQNFAFHNNIGCCGIHNLVRTLYFCQITLGTDSVTLDN